MALFTNKPGPLPGSLVRLQEGTRGMRGLVVAVMKEAQPGSTHYVTSSMLVLTQEGTMGQLRGIELFESDRDTLWRIEWSP